MSVVSEIMSKYVFVTGRFDYADEFYCEVLGVFTEKEWEDKKAVVEAYFKKPGAKTVEIYFGTNEAIEVEYYQGWLSNFIVKKIKEPEAKLLAKLFGQGPNKEVSCTFGTGDGVFDTSRFTNEEE